ncbi:DUF6153 family protein [Actinoplanes sp. NPDC051513]|uniref:DUF6153 family protein n=1 Tax=Actinoplanes sp. NPDC051513 TaxID=3363908 RepID=UPI0037BCF9F1
MTGEPAAVAGRAARWLLLACTLFGLAAMHTLGHSGMHMDDHAGHQPTGPVMAAAAAMNISSDAVAITVTAGCPGCGGMAEWNVCLAVLTGLAVLVLLAALLLARRRPGGAPARSARTRPRVPRGPPRPAGLAVTAISVLRI